MKRLTYCALAIYWSAIFIATHLPKTSMPSLNWSDKLYHASAFLGLTFLLCWSLVQRWSDHGGWWKACLGGLTIAALYAVFDENTQRLVPGRTYDLYDIFADIVGAFLGVFAFLISKLLLPSRGSSSPA